MGTGNLDGLCRLISVELVVLFSPARGDLLHQSFRTVRGGLHSMWVQCHADCAARQGEMASVSPDRWMRPGVTLCFWATHGPRSRSTCYLDRDEFPCT